MTCVYDSAFMELKNDVVFINGEDV